MKCSFCQAEIKGTPNIWHVCPTPTDNTNLREDISKWPVSWSSVVVKPMCSQTCLQSYIKKYSGETISDAKLQGANNGTSIKSILNEPYKQGNKTPQELTQEGYKRLAEQKKLDNDNNKGDGRGDVGLSKSGNCATPEETSSLKQITDKLKTIKNMENKQESKARHFIACDSCSKMIHEGEGIEAILDDKSKPNKGKEKATKAHHVCNEVCLRNLLEKRASAKKVKKSSASDYYIDMIVD